VIATHDRRDSLLATLAELDRLPERPPTVVVDNASGDGTVAAVERAFPAVDVVALPRNRGVSARNIGVARLHTPYVALCDDDSWWRPASLGRAATLFRRFPSLGLLAARILVGPWQRLDPVSAEMRGQAPPGLPGPRVHGFVACGALVRRAAFLDARGFCERFLIGSEETLLALDMSAAGWDLCYVDELVAIHMPHGEHRADRPWMSCRNALWTSWMRMPLRIALAESWKLGREAIHDPVARQAFLAALWGLPWAVSERRSGRRPVGRRDDGADYAGSCGSAETFRLD